MRAPPEAEIEISGTPAVPALSQARANFSPLTEPIEVNSPSYGGDPWDSFDPGNIQVTFVDVTNKRRPRMISRTGYAGSGYTHQGWLTEDQRYFLVDDEFDEIEFGHGSRTYVWDVSDLDAPRLIGNHTLPNASTDHNLFIRGNRAYLANYTSGLRILDLSEVGAGHLREVAFFDIVPESDAPGFVGAWSMPIKSSDGRVLGTIGTYFRDQRAPTLAELRGVELLADAAGALLARS